MKLLWVTNIPTPYAASVWEAVTNRAGLVVACAAETESNRHWEVRARKTDIRYLHAPYLRRGYEQRIYLFSRRAFRLEIRKMDAVLIDGWDSLLGLQVLIISKLLRKPVVLTYWSTGYTHKHKTGPVSWYRRQFVRACDYVVTPGIAATEAASAIIGPSRGAAVVTGNASIDIEYWKRARLMRGPRDVGHNFLFVGQLIPRKNVSLLVSAFRAIAEPGDTLTIVGDGPLRKELEFVELSRAPVNLRGDLQGEDLLRAYADADTLVLPSREEVWGIVTLEALAAGLNVVVSDACGAARDLSQMQCVYRFDSNSQSALEAALCEARTKWNGPNSENLSKDFAPSAMADKIVGLVGQLSGYKHSSTIA